MSGLLYLIPSLLGNENYEDYLPNRHRKILPSAKYFIVENIRTARRFLKHGGYIDNFDDITFFILDKHTKAEDYSIFLNPAKQGHNIALLSEAGCPCIADPGAIIVDMAHKENIKVVPLIGPSSIMLALMASGFNGQNFVFHGYIDIKTNERRKRIIEIERAIYNKNQTQIFIEAPFRNQALFEAILKTAKPHSKLCIAMDITLENEFIKTLSIQEWRKKNININKRQAVFLMYK